VLQKIELFSSNPSAPELPLGGFMPSDDPVQVRSIDGLGPVKAEVASSAFATGRGELYQGSSVGKRNIVMTLGLNPDWAEQTMSNLRQKLYRYLLPQAWTKLRFFSDYLPVVDIEGIVESFEPNIFSQDPEVQVSILCHKPDFIEADAISYEGVVDDGATELEFEYVGSVNTGLELRIDRTVANPSYLGDISVALKSPEDPQNFVAEDVTIDTLKYFKLSSVPNAKRVQSIAVADGAITNLLSKMTTESVWPEIKPGVNVLSVAAAEPGQKWTMAYFNRFGGL
jgi:hypothetical protein